MNRWRLIQKNIVCYRRYYRLIAVASLVMVTVIVGSLVIGDSVRTTLVKQVEERLGDTETIILSRSSFLTDRFTAAPMFKGTARGVLLTNGFVSQGNRLIPVTVWGVDYVPVDKNAVQMNQALADELEQENAGELVLRLPATGMVPSGSLFVTDNYTTSLRLRFGGILQVEDGGNLNLRNEQITPFNLFVNRETLAEAMGVAGKINLILTPETVSEQQLNEGWKLNSAGLLLRSGGDYTEITSDRVFLPKEAVQTLCRFNKHPNRLFSYLANSISSGGTHIPYSFVTAMDHFQGEPIHEKGIILSDYSAHRLGVELGDTIEVTYFTSGDLKLLRTDAVRLRLERIVPLSVLRADSTLSADFPGLSDVERCTDWNSDLPIDMSLIADEDEHYWKLYRSTPKAIIAYNAVAEDWSNAYGVSTALRVADQNPDLSELTPDMFGVQILYPRQVGLQAARNGVDFSGLFLALSFFILLAALLLMLIPLSDMLNSRRREIDLLRALGYTQRRIVQLLWIELCPVVSLASVVGVVTGLAYTSGVMWLLGTVWRGATQTDGFSVYPTLPAVLSGLVAGLILSLGVLSWAIARALKEKSETDSPSHRNLTALRWLAYTSVSVAAGLSVVNWLMLQSVVLFVLSGGVWLVAATLSGDYLLTRKAILPDYTFNRLSWSSLYAGRKQARLCFLALAAGVFIVFSVGLNRKGFTDSSQLRTGTGGYTFWCETSVPVYYDLSAKEGRERLSLGDLPQDVEILQCLRYNGDDASCLNLNKVSVSSVLGVDMSALCGSDFGIEQSLFKGSRERVFEQMQMRKDDVYPAWVDATVLTWGLGLSLGDTLQYIGDGGRRISIRLAGTLENSVFQGYILIDRSLFREIWKETAGSELFLLKAGEEKNAELKNLLTQALSEYGVRVSATTNRLKQFNAVTDTYLTIFMTLGGLGLLLGIAGFLIVIRKNLVRQRGETQMYRALGFTDRRIEAILIRENLPVPLYAIGAAVFSALVGISGSFRNVSPGLWALTVCFALIFVACVVVFVRRLVRKELENKSY